MIASPVYVSVPKFSAEFACLFLVVPSVYLNPSTVSLFNVTERFTVVFPITFVLSPFTETDKVVAPLAKVAGATVIAEEI